MSVHVYTHPACLEHDTGAEHPESVARLEAVLAGLRAAALDLTWQQAPAATRGQLLRVHAASLLADVLEQSVADAPIRLDPDTLLSAGSAAAALHAAGAGVAAVDAVLGGQARTAFCAVRPPGHHATGADAMGFCLFNNVAVAAAHAIERHGLSRVAVVDFDVHHGNGTQAILESEPRALYLSSHQFPLFPDTGARHERGLGNILNVPLRPGSGSAVFREAWQSRLLPELDAFRPQLVLISAGFDAHRRDPMADLQLETADYAWITEALVIIAGRHAAGRVVSTLEGGYDLQALREGVVAHVQALAGAA